MLLLNELHNSLLDEKCDDGDGDDYLFCMQLYKQCHTLVCVYATNAFGIGVSNIGLCLCQECFWHSDEQFSGGDDSLVR